MLLEFVRSYLIMVFINVVPLWYGEGATYMSLFGNVVLVMLFVFFYKYVWVKKYVKIYVMLFKY